MSRNLSIAIIVVVVLLALAVLGGLVWANSRYVRANPHEKDFLVPWLAARTFLQYGDSPYSDPATQRAQIQYYGRLALPGEDPLYLWLAFPIELLYFPLALIPDYVLARALWLTCLEVALAALGLLSVRLARWKPANSLLPFILLTSVLGVYGALCLVTGSPAALAALGLAGFLLALQAGRDEAAGALLLVALCVPRLSGVFFVFILWWIIYQRRWRVIGGGLMSLAILLVLSFLILPGWILPFLRGLLARGLYTHVASSISLFAAWSPGVGLRLGWVLTGLLLLMLFIEWGNVLREDFRHFLWTVGLTLAVTPLLGIPVAPQDFVFLFIPWALFLSILAERYSRPGRWGVPAVFLLVEFAGLWLLTVLLVRSGSAQALEASLFFFLPVLLIVGLYWMHWWFLRQPRSGLEPFE